MSGVILPVILGLILAPHPRHWTQYLIPAVALGVTVTVTVTVNRGTIIDHKTLRNTSACKGLQDIA